MKLKLPFALTCALLIGSLPPGLAHAEEPTPAPGTLELGIFGGLFFPDDDHVLVEPGITQRSLSNPSPDFGLRGTFFLSHFFALEAEGALMPSSVDGGGDGLVYGVRGHILLQVPNQITPFVVFGAGVLGINSSSTDALGDDEDAALHWGVGAKLALNEALSVRLDGRHIISPALNRDAGLLSHFEGLLGLSVALGQTNPDPDGDGIEGDADLCPDTAGIAPRGCPDADGDGFDDTIDKCPADAGIAPDGCPPKDEDGDGVPDTDDACPAQAGLEALGGCPDGDSDGIPDGQDACPATAGVAPDGCPPPPPDTDGDGIIDADDKCPNEAETKNEFRDEDGCPDEIPQEVKRFTGVIENITFRSGSARLRPSSFRTLRKVADVLKEYPSVHIEIDGHTDNTGDHDKNVELSKARAQAVKNYLVDKAGVEADRLKVDGFGPDQPVASNDTRAGRASG